jgi:phosphopantothenoylcysteine decarboxylase/phosphopantothenate--cysteine ligase
MRGENDMRFLVTAGPTREYIDAVRFISNPSTGKMGVAVAQRAFEKGHEVALILGPTHIEPPREIRTIRVASAREMLDAVGAEYERCDCLVMTAAVCDYAPKAKTALKIKKGDSPMTLELVRTPDILKHFAPRKGRRVHVGFALEVQDPAKHAHEKLISKHLDFIVLDSPEAFGADSASAAIIAASGETEEFKDISKSDLAARIVERAEKIFKAAGGSAR